MATGDMRVGLSEMGASEVGIIIDNVSGQSYENSLDIALP
jgi:hypothetical protein